MKRIVWNITLASIMTLAAYIALYAIWGAVLSEVENPTLRLFLTALMTAAAFGFCLLYTSKIRGAAGEREVVSDYKDRKYVSPADDLKSAARQEARRLVCIAAVVLICFALNTADALVFGKKTISLVTFLFFPMCIFDTCIGIPFAGYALSAAADCVMYMIFLLIYRKKKYDYWMKSKEE